jgi:hypothetical protein
MMEERYHATTQNRFYPDMSNVNKNITVEVKLISPPTYITKLMLGCNDGNVTVARLLFKAKMPYLEFLTFRFSLSHLVSVTELCARMTWKSK